MQQLIEPNLSVVGVPDYCLAYVESVFGVKNDPDPDAWQGWLDTQFKHSDPIPTNLSFPVWFSWTGTIGGVTKNWGHVAVSTPQGVYTNPLQGSGHKVLPNVQALEAAYGVEYIGWSEDIGNLKVIGGRMYTDDQINAMFEARDQRMDADEANVGRLYVTVDGINKKQASDEANVGRLYVTVDQINKRVAILESKK